MGAKRKTTAADGMADAVCDCVRGNQAAVQRAYLGEECRIVRAYRFLPDGEQVYALKTITGCLALSADKTALIDLAEARYLKIVEIAD